MVAYYNENDTKTAAWLRELIKKGLISDGEVDERSISDVVPAELAGFDRCHFFAGIGIWDYALNRTGWTGKVWTGSCPCQPFSAAGKGEGFADERHLWPDWFHLIHAYTAAFGHIPAIFGEQVSSKDGLSWLDLVQVDLESIGYTFGPLDIPAASVGAPHRRQRFYFVADAEHARHDRPRRNATVKNSDKSEERLSNGNRTASRVALTDGGNASEEREQRSREQRSREQRQQPQDGGSGRLVNAERRRREQRDEGEWSVQVADAGCSTSLLVEPDRERCEEQRDGFTDEPEQPCVELPSIAGSELHLPKGMRLRESGSGGGSDQQQLPDSQPVSMDASGMHRSFTNGFWADAEWIWCRDGKYRPTKPGIFPLAYGNTAGRVATLRGAGNAIVAENAIAFIESYLEIQRNK